LRCVEIRRKTTGGTPAPQKRIRIGAREMVCTDPDLCMCC
jgi:hypothetical protein